MRLRLYQLVEINEGREGIYIYTPKTLDDFINSLDTAYYQSFYGDDYSEITREWLESLALDDHFIAGERCDDNYMYISVYEITID